jgi:hypothetical protein
MPQLQAVAARRLAIYIRFVALHTIAAFPACAPNLYAQIVNLTLAWDPNPEPSPAMSSDRNPSRQARRTSMSAMTTQIFSCGQSRHYSP